MAAKPTRATAKKSTAVATRNKEFTAETAIALLKSGDEITESMISKFTFGGGNTDMTARDIEMRDFTATTRGELFGGDATGSATFVDKVFCLTDVTFNKSDRKGQGLTFYAVLHAVTADGEVVAITSSARNIVRKASIAKVEGMLDEDKPLWLIITASETESGNTALNLKAAPADRIPFPIED